MLVGHPGLPIRCDFVKSAEAERLDEPELSSRRNPGAGSDPQTGFPWSFVLFETLT